MNVLFVAAVAVVFVVAAVVLAGVAGALIWAQRADSITVGEQGRVAAVAAIAFGAMGAALIILTTALLL